MYGFNFWNSKCLGFAHIISFFCVVLFDRRMDLTGFIELIIRQHDAMNSIRVVWSFVSNLKAY